MLTFDSPVIFWLVVFGFAIIAQIINLVRFKKERALIAILYLIINAINIVILYGLSLLCQNNLHGWAWTIIVLKCILIICTIVAIDLHTRQQKNIKHEQ